MSQKWIPLLAGAVFLTGCATSNPFSNVPIEDRGGRPAAAPAPLPTEVPGVIVTPVDPGMGVSVQPIEVTSVVRSQRDLPPADEMWQPVSPQIQSPAPQSGAPMQPAPQPLSMPAAIPSDNTAVVALLEGARLDSEQGDLRAAQTRLERALRIAPREAEVYYQLADVKRQLGQFLDAEQVALRGVGVAEGQRQELRRLWILISQIRSEAGDLAGAEDARNAAAAF
ncbi:tetratricopeptide repeat protein [Nitrincola tapanii]|uniref:Tetratricopeptide repeat protein n=1 Tax=Nitrincola tapanii TaxID=1708751 RepID=A0A5A9W0K2_9GAMM|nr:tetratricopeptide repeat protein [Nitrincola tapanii]KAA0873655.1 tetratricopeptide repeat protein [Nitrincola tapanii]